jgi:probable rRNA maturation factor
MSNDPDPARAIVIDLAIPCARWRRAVPGVERVATGAARAALARAARKIGVAELSLVLADDATSASLNERWRHRAGPTNVLAFATGAQPAAATPLLLGDVILAYETVMAEAKNQGKTAADHLRHLVIHGVLHLLGYDHDAAGAARRMETLETRILATLGVSDPYRLREATHG